MRISPVYTNRYANGITQSNPVSYSNQTNATKYKNLDNYQTGDFISFGDTKTAAIEKNLKSNFGVECKVRSNLLVAECVENTVKIFNDTFGKSALPQKVEFLSFKNYFDVCPELVDALGVHVYFKDSPKNEVYFNADYDCYQSKSLLQFTHLTEKLLWWHPTGHYLQTFVHEFGHSAHFNHLLNRGNIDVMPKMSSAKIPTVVGRFITKFKLGIYAATNLNEFMAERITKDICKNLNSENKFVGKKEDLDYSNIFSNKWSYRYSSPQAYLDYFTQQIWNGDIEEAYNATGKMERYLKEIEALEYAEAIAKAKKTSVVKKVPFFEKIVKKIEDFSRSYTVKQDKNNKLRMKY